MTPRLELFLQGGLGNQLIQLAYAESIRTRMGGQVSINPLMLHPLWARLRSISRRERCWPWASAMPEVNGLVRQLYGFGRLYQSRLSEGPFTDRCGDQEILQRIIRSRAGAWHGLLGYFQRRQAFGESAQGFWTELKQRLLLRYPLKPFPHGQVVAHIRLGDYLWPENQRLFAHYPLAQQLRDARQWSQRLGGPETIHLVTDDPEHLRHLLALQSPGSFLVYQGRSAEEDFLFLTRHRHIVGSNSTFSFCSAKLAAELWSVPQTLSIPARWYVDADLDQQIQSEWSSCSFVDHIDSILTR